MDTTDELQKRLVEAEARERELLRRNRELMAKKSIRGHLYDRIDVSVATMDIIIIACTASIIFLIALGAYYAK